VLERPLLEQGATSFIRYNQAIPILRKVKHLREPSFANLVSSRKPFGFPTNYEAADKPFEGSVLVFGSKGDRYVPKEVIAVNKEWVFGHKVLISRAYGERISKNYWVTGKPFLGKPGTCCAETYLVIGPFDSQQVCENVMSYIKTRFFRFLVILRKNTQDAPKGVYQYVPVQDFSKPWTDEELYEKYGLEESEIVFIESMIRPME
jgi:site-specific DNA-methyltransferase (adenine-specific)